MEKTVILIKPDAMKKQLVGKIIDRFEMAGFKIAGVRLIKFTQDQLNVWYAHHKDKPFFQDLSNYMMSMPMVAMVLTADNAVARVRDMVGPTDSRQAPKGTLRGDYGENIQKNVVHASDTPERTEFEVSLLFKPEEILYK